MRTSIFNSQITVPASAIDTLNHVNSLVYLDWCLETAEAHWQAKTTPELRQRFVWVVLNHFIEYKAPSFEGEDLEVQTWIETYEGVKCDRHYKIIRLKDNQTIVEAKTLWALLNGKNFRPTRITEEISSLFFK